MPPMSSTTSLRTASAGPRAKRIPSTMSATITPEDISMDSPSASSDDQMSDAGIPRYIHVTRPTLGSNRDGMTFRRKSDEACTSLSVITKYDRFVAAIIFSKEKVLAFGKVGGPVNTI